MTTRTYIASFGVFLALLAAGCGGGDTQKEPPTNGNITYCVDEMFPTLNGFPAQQPFCYGCKPPCSLIQTPTQSAPQLLVIPLGTLIGNEDAVEALPGVIPRGALDLPNATCTQCPPDGVKGKLIKRRAGPGFPALNILVLM